MVVNSYFNVDGDFVIIYSDGMNATPQQISFSPASECLSGAESDFVANFVGQVVEFARRSGQEILAALDMISRTGQTFDWRTTEFLGIQRVRIAVYDRCKDLDARDRVSAERIRQEVSALAFSTMADYVKPDEFRPGDVTFDFTNLTPAQWAAIESVEYEESVTGGKRKYKLKLHRKLVALEQLAKHIGFDDPGNPYRAREQAREQVAQAPLAAFAQDTDLAKLQDAYARLLTQSGGG